MKRKHKIKKLNSETQNEEFHTSLKEARETQKYGVYVYLDSPDAYKSMVLIMIGEGEGGLAIHDGDIVAVHKNRTKTTDKLMGILGETALKYGGEKLDCYGAHLANEYMQLGLLPVGKVKFNLEKADPKWDTKIHGEPDVIAMLLPKRYVRQDCPTTYEELEANLPYFDDYDELLLFRDEILKEIREKNLSYDDALEIIKSNQLMERKNDPTYPA